MRKDKYYLAINDYEYSIIIDCLINSWNKFISSMIYIYAVYELIVKFAHAPVKKFKIKMAEV